MQGWNGRYAGRYNVRPHCKPGDRKRLIDVIKPWIVITIAR